MFGWPFLLQDARQRYKTLKKTDERLLDGDRIEKVSHNLEPLSAYK